MIPALLFIFPNFWRNGLTEHCLPDRCHARLCCVKRKRATHTDTESVDVNTGVTVSVPEETKQIPDEEAFIACKALGCKFKTSNAKELTMHRMKKHPQMMDQKEQKLRKKAPQSSTSSSTSSPSPSSLTSVSSTVPETSQVYTQHKHTQCVCVCGCVSACVPLLVFSTRNF